MIGAERRRQRILRERLLHDAQLIEENLTDFLLELLFLSNRSRELVVGDRIDSSLAI